MDGEAASELSTGITQLMDAWDAPTLLYIPLKVQDFQEWVHISLPLPRAFKARLNPFPQVGKLWSEWICSGGWRWGTDPRQHPAFCDRLKLIP